MELADCSLSDRVRQPASLGLREILALVGGIAGALLDAREWIHRDVRPENILRVKGKWKLSDWGAAIRADAVQTHVLLPELGRTVAPEVLDRRAEKRSDVYSLGAVFRTHLEVILAAESQRELVELMEEFDQEDVDPARASRAWLRGSPPSERTVDTLGSPTTAADVLKPTRQRPSGV